MYLCLLCMVDFVPGLNAGWETYDSHKRATTVFTNASV